MNIFAAMPMESFLFKQWGEWRSGERMGKHRAGRVLDGRTWDEYPS